MCIEPSSFDKTKAIIIDTKNFTNVKAWQAFLDYDFASEEEIIEVTNLMEEYRPEIAEKIVKYFGL